MGLLALGTVWTGVHRFHSQAKVQQTASAAAQSPQAVAPTAAAERPQASAAVPLPTVLHQEMPHVSRGARESIRGVIKIAVRVIVDRSGNVAAAMFDNRGPSQYFARATMDAARKWKFAQTADQASRLWLLHFEFTRNGVTAHAAALP